MLGPHHSSETFFDRAVAVRESAGFGLGGLEFFGVSDEFRKITNLCDDFIDHASKSTTEVARSSPIKFAVLLEPGNGKTTMAKAVVNDLSAKSIPITMVAQSSDWQNLVSPSDRSQQPITCAVIDDLPEEIGKRSTALRKIAEWRGQVILFTSSNYRFDEGMSIFSEIVRLSPIDDRIEDKNAWLLCLLLTEAEVRWTSASKTIATMLNSISPGAFEACVELSSWAGHLHDLDNLAAHILDQLDLLSIGGDEKILPNRDLYKCFRRIIGERPSDQQDALNYRIWVEGVSDKVLLELATRLAQEKDGINYLNGLSIEIMGGTTSLSNILKDNQISSERDLFLFDNDDDGQHARDQLKRLDHNTDVLPRYFLRKSIPTDRHLDIEIEDLINIDLIDKFYKENREYIPEFEGLYYKGQKIRRLVVRGEDKESFVEWIVENACFEDIERVFYVFYLVRNRFPLPGKKTDQEMRVWRTTLCDPNHRSSNLGLRPEPWWPYAS